LDARLIVRSPRRAAAVFEHERTAVCVALGVDAALGSGPAELDGFSAALRAALAAGGCPEVAIGIL
jgi:hypothetical protein